MYSGDLEKDKGFDVLERADGIVVPGGFGYRGIEGKVIAARFARERKVPYLGLCLGMQVMCIEFARHVLNMEDANSTEFETHHRTPGHRPDARSAQHHWICGGTMRLGLYPCVLEDGTMPRRVTTCRAWTSATATVSSSTTSIRHQFEAGGMRLSGLSPDRKLVEIAEIADHPFMVGSQFHPEFHSRPNRPHPLFMGLIAAAMRHQQGITEPFVPVRAAQEAHGAPIAAPATPTRSEPPDQDPSNGRE